MPTKPWKDAEREGVALEPFSRVQSVRQAREVNPLVTSQLDWLQQAQPGTAHRYRSLSAAARNIFRLTGGGTFNAYIIRRQNVAVGLATIISDQSLIHPVEGTAEGADLDYWLTIGSSPRLHRGVAHTLIVQNQRMQHFTSGDLKSFATVEEGLDNPAIGFKWNMRRIGRPAVLATPFPEDRYDIAKGGAVLQLFGHNQDLT